MALLPNYAVSPGAFYSGPNMPNICNYGLKRCMFVLNLARPFKAFGSPASAVILSSCCIKYMEDGETAAIDAMRLLEAPPFFSCLQTYRKVRPLDWSLTPTRPIFILVKFPKQCPTSCPRDFRCLAQRFLCLHVFLAVSPLRGHMDWTDLTSGKTSLLFFSPSVWPLCSLSPASYWIQQTQHKLLLLLVTSPPSLSLAQRVLHLP